MNFSKKLKVAISILAILILTNPSRSSFISFLHQVGNDGAGREFNGILFSVYSKVYYVNYDEESKRVRYIGILGNFFKIQTIEKSIY